MDVQILLTIYQPSGNPNNMQKIGTPIPTPTHIISISMYKITTTFASSFNNFSVILLSIFLLRDKGCPLVLLVLPSISLPYCKTPYSRFYIRLIKKSNMGSDKTKPRVVNTQQEFAKSRFNPYSEGGIRE